MRSNHWLGGYGPTADRPHSTPQLTVTLREFRTPVAGGRTFPGRGPRKVRGSPELSWMVPVYVEREIDVRLFREPGDKAGREI